MAEKGESWFHTDHSSFCQKSEWEPTFLQCKVYTVFLKVLMYRRKVKAQLVLFKVILYQSDLREKQLLVIS